MSKIVSILPRARLELASYSLDYERLTAGLGTRFERQIRKATNLIAVHPRLYASVGRRIRLAPVRKFPFALAYRVTRREIEVFAIIPTKSNPITWPTGS